MRFLVVIFTVMIVHSMMVIQSEALRCYACSYTSTADHLCLNDPISVTGGIVNCNKKYCTIFRQELQTPSGRVNSFLRDCQEEPVFLNQIVEDPTYKTFYRSCTSDLCNSGDGIGSDNSFNPDNPGENMIIDGLNPNGTGGGLSNFPSHMLCLLLPVIGAAVAQYVNY